MENSSGSVNKRKRKRQQPVFDKTIDFFLFLGTETNKKDANLTIDMYECILCKLKLNGTKKSNLTSHLKVHHNGTYVKMMNKDKDSFAVRRLKLLQHFTEIVAVNGRTFTHLLDSGFKKIIEPKLRKLHEAGYGLNMTNHNLPEVKKHLQQTAEKIREKIKLEVKGRLLSLMVDIVTKNNRSVLGVSLQYVFDAKLRIRSIGMVDLNKSHTAIYLKDVIINLLKRYDIDLKQIITITTDNGANVQKMVRDIENHLQKDVNEARVVSDDVNEHVHIVTETDESTDEAIVEILSTDNDITDDEAIDIIFDQVVYQENETLLNAITNEMRDSGFDFIWDITGINCAEHTLQLAIKDGQKNVGPEVSNLIELCRRVCKFFRRDSTRNEMEKAGIDYIRPRLENDTRWGTLYLMVSFNFFLWT